MSESPEPVHRGRSLRTIGIVLLVTGILLAVAAAVAGRVAERRTVDSLEPVTAGETVTFRPGGSTKGLVFGDQDVSCSATGADGREVAMGDAWPYLGGGDFHAAWGFSIQGGETYRITCLGGDPDARFAVAELSVFNAEPFADLVLLGPVVALIGVALMIVAAVRRSAPERAAARGRPAGPVTS